MKKTSLLLALLTALCLVGCGQSTADGEPAEAAEEAVAEEAAVEEEAAAVEESTGEEIAVEDAAEAETADDAALTDEAADTDDASSADEAAAADDESAATTDKTTELTDGFFTLYTRDGAHSVTFPSVGSLMGVDGGTLSGTPDAICPWGRTSEALNATYGVGSYEYDCESYASPEEYLADKVPDKYTIESYYSEGYEEGAVKTTEINGYTVYSQRFAFTEYGEVRRFWHVGLMTEAGKLLTLEFSEASDTDLLDVPLADDWFVPVIEGMTEG